MTSPRDRDLAKIHALKQRLQAAEEQRTVEAVRHAEAVSLHKLERDASRLKSRALAHRIPSEVALRLVLPERAAALRQIATHHAVPAASLPADVDVTTTAGLTFFVPREVRAPGKLADRILSGWLPLREIAEARDIAVGAIMIDIGANVGTTVLPRIALGDFMWAFAAEAEPANAACLRRAVEANGMSDRVVVDHTAIADRDGTIELSVSTQIGTHRVLLDLAPARDTVSVPCRRLDTWVQERQIDLALTTFVKCDVEGSEMSVLLGAPGVLARRHIAWQIEFSPAALRTQGVEPADFLAFVANHFGYFIDLQGDGSRARCRPIAELSDALGYVGDLSSYTNIVLFNGSAAASR